MNPDCHPVDQQQRQDDLDTAYSADGRHDPSHPHHATYTALMAPNPEPTLEDLLAQWWRDSFPNAPINSKTAELMVQFAAYALQQRCGSDA